MTKRVVVGISGASGAVYGARALELLADTEGVETHLVMSSAATITLEQETNRRESEVRALADVVHEEGDIGASIASGSFLTEGMIIAPCSIKTLSAVANSFTQDLLIRAADVCLKERRPLVLMVREAPLHLGHLRLMTLASEAGATIFPPVPAFYTRPESIQQLVDQSVGRALDVLGIHLETTRRWQGVAGG